MAFFSCVVYRKNAFTSSETCITIKLRALILHTRKSAEHFVCSSHIFFHIANITGVITDR